MIMASAAMRDHTRSAAELDRAGYADVWPRVEHEDRSLSGGRLYRNWYPRPGLKSEKVRQLRTLAADPTHSVKGICVGHRMLQGSLAMEPS
jgi:hypothetical protein